MNYIVEVSKIQAILQMTAVSIFNHHHYLHHQMFQASGASARLYAAA